VHTVQPVSVFLKLSAVAEHFIGGRSAGSYTKVYASEYEKHYTGCESYHNHIFSKHYFEVFSKIMLEGQKVLEITTFCRRSTNEGSVNTEIYGCVFHLLRV
jgi:hypothetical protein